MLLEFFKLNESIPWLIKKIICKQNTNLNLQQHTNIFGFRIKIDSRYHRLLNDFVKRNTKIYGMGTFKSLFEKVYLYQTGSFSIKTFF